MRRRHLRFYGKRRRSPSEMCREAELRAEAARAAAKLDPKAPCTHPDRNGRHEWYIRKGKPMVCVACGVEESEA